MARQPRIEFEGAVYHAMSRGARHQAIFVNDTDRRSFLSLLGEAHERFAIEVYAYCLMGNHYHLLIHTPRANLSEAMRHINGVHTQRFNVHHKTDGPLFRGRFLSPLVDSNEYLIHVSRYIHRNPVEAGLVALPSEHRWSSFRVYARQSHCPSWLRTSMVLNTVGGPSPRGTYAAAVERPGIHPELAKVYEGPDLPMAIGSEQFKKSIAELAESVGADDPTENLELVDVTVGRAFGVTPGSLIGGRRGQRNVARMAATSISHVAGVASLAQLARHYGFGSTSGVSSAITRLSQLETTDPNLARRLARLRAEVEGSGLATPPQPA